MRLCRQSSLSLVIFVAIITFCIFHCCVSDRCQSKSFWLSLNIKHSMPGCIVSLGVFISNSLMLNSHQKKMHVFKIQGPIRCKSYWPERCHVPRTSACARGEESGLRCCWQRGGFGHMKEFCHARNWHRLYFRFLPMMQRLTNGTWGRPWGRDDLGMPSLQSIWLIFVWGKARPF